MNLVGDIGKCLGCYQKYSVGQWELYRVSQIGLNRVVNNLGTKGGKDLRPFVRLLRAIVGPSSLGRFHLGRTLVCNCQAPGCAAGCLHNGDDPGRLPGSLGTLCVHE